MRRRVESLADGGERIIYEFGPAEVGDAHWLDWADDEDLGRLVRAVAHHIRDREGRRAVSVTAAASLLIRECMKLNGSALDLTAESVRTPTGRGDFHIRISRREVMDVRGR